MEEEVPYNKRQDDTGNSTDTGTGSAVEQDSVKQKGHSRKKLVKVLTNKYFIVTFIFAVIVLFVDRNNLIRWAGDYLEVLRQERVIRQYGRDIEELDRKLDQPGEIRPGGVLLPPGGRGSVYCRLNWVMVRSMPASPKDLTASTALSLISGSCLSSSSSHFPRTKSI